jgi:hypothetical protein
MAGAPTATVGAHGITPRRGQDGSCAHSAAPRARFREEATRQLLTADEEPMSECEHRANSL